MLIPTNFGLLEQDISAIVNVFGSRAKNTYKSGSDVDIALLGQDITNNTVVQVSYQLNEETLLPYKFDILNYQAIINQNLKKHIDRVGIVFYNLL